MAELTWLGHACFRLRGREAVVVFDPIDRPGGVDLSRLRADIVTISHAHPRHSHRAGLSGSCTVIDGPGEYEIKEVFITGVRTDHDDAKGTVAGANTVYVVHLEDLIFCHLGDLGHALSSEQLEQIGSVDILMVPAGGRPLSVARAAEVISQLEPGLVVPMHYATEAAPVAELDTIEKFGREMGLNDFTTRDRLTVRRSDIPEATQIVVLSDRGV